MRLNKRGVVPLDILFTGVLANGAGSGFLCAVILLTAFTLQPSVTTPFRFNKAVAMCESEGRLKCKDVVSGWSKEKILEYIKDDAVAMPIKNYGYLYRADNVKVVSR